MAAQTVKINADKGLTLPLAFWKRLGFREGEEFVVQEQVPVITLIPKSLIKDYNRSRTLSAVKLKQLGLADERVWKKEQGAFRNIRLRLNKEEYPELYA